MDNQKTWEQISDETKDVISKTFRSIVEWVKKAVKWFVERIKVYLAPLFKIIKDHKAIARHKNNQYNRSTWITVQDTRKNSQVMNNRPAVYVRKIIR